MTEALRAMLGFGFCQLGLHRIEAACLPSNASSRGLLLKAGFSQEGYARAYLRIGGEWQDHLLFALLREDFEKFSAGWASSSEGRREGTECVRTCSSRGWQSH